MRRGIGWRHQIIAMADQGLRTLGAESRARRPRPIGAVADRVLTEHERLTSIRLMRVNRAGEISAQALYIGQAVFARAEDTREHLLRAADEERDHLTWCTERLAELGGRSSILDPLWFTASACIGLAVGLAGDTTSLGFVAETERQVEAHLDDHLGRLPEADASSRSILTQMSKDEAHHGTMAQLAGGTRIREPVRTLMAAGGSLLRRFALYV